MVIAVDSIVDMPAKIVDCLGGYKEAFLNENYLDNIITRPWASKIEKELDEYCLVHGVIGYHYTRANREDIEVHGLTIMPGEKRRSWFLKKYSSRFTKGQIEVIRETWQKYFNKFQNSARDLKIWFNLVSSQ